MLARILAPFASSAEASRLFGLASAPNALFAFAFFFLGLDPARYSAYAPLLMAGKAVSLASAGLLAPSLVAAFAEDSPGGLDPLPIIIVAAFDLLAIAYLSISGRRGRAGHAPADSHATAPRRSEPEIVEIK